MAPLNKTDMTNMMMFIIQNPYIRNIQELSRLTGYSEKSVRKALAALNITRSTKPKHCKG